MTVVPKHVLVDERWPIKAHLESELVEEQHGAVALGGVGCDLPQRMAHQPRLGAHYTWPKQTEIEAGT